MPEVAPIVILPDGTPRILFCGATTLDTIFRVDTLPVGPGKVVSKQMTVVAHGMAASAAATAARLGASAMLFSLLGDDDTGQLIRDDLSAAGVDCTGVRRFAGVASALKCQTFGGRIGAPDRAELLRFLQGSVR